MAKQRMTVEKLRRIQARTRVFVLCRRVMLLACALAVGTVVVAMAMPEREVLNELEAQLADTVKREQLIAAEKQDYETELRALREDPAFLELHARDRLDYYREGEKILKFRE